VSTCYPDLHVTTTAAAASSPPVAVLCTHINMAAEVEAALICCVCCRGRGGGGRGGGGQRFVNRDGGATGEGSYQRTEGGFREGGFREVGFREGGRGGGRGGGQGGGERQPWLSLSPEQLALRRVRISCPTSSAMMLSQGPFPGYSLLCKLRYNPPGGHTHIAHPTCLILSCCTGCVCTCLVLSGAVPADQWRSRVA
jgi:hypothetical protein